MYLSYLQLAEGEENTCDDCRSLVSSGFSSSHRVHANPLGEIPEPFCLALNAPLLEFPIGQTSPVTGELEFEEERLFYWHPASSPRYPLECNEFVLLASQIFPASAAELVVGAASVWKITRNKEETRKILEQKRPRDPAIASLFSCVFVRFTGFVVENVFFPSALLVGRPAPQPRLGKLYEMRTKLRLDMAKLFNGIRASEFFQFDQVKKFVAEEFSGALRLEAFPENKKTKENQEISQERKDEQNQSIQSSALVHSHLEPRESSQPLPEPRRPQAVEDEPPNRKTPSDSKNQKSSGTTEYSQSLEPIEQLSDSRFSLPNDQRPDEVGVVAGENKEIFEFSQSQTTRLSQENSSTISKVSARSRSSRRSTQPRGGGLYQLEFCDSQALGLGEAGRAGATGEIEEIEEPQLEKRESWRYAAQDAEERLHSVQGPTAPRLQDPPALISSSVPDSLSPLANSSPKTPLEFSALKRIPAYWRIPRGSGDLLSGRGLEVSLSLEIFDFPTLMAKSPDYQFRFHTPFSFVDASENWFFAPSLRSLMKEYSEPDFLLAIPDDLLKKQRNSVNQQAALAFAVKLMVAARSGWVLECRDWISHERVSGPQKGKKEGGKFQQVLSVYFVPTMPDSNREEEKTAALSISDVAGPRTLPNPDSPIFLQVFLCPPNFLALLAIRDYVKAAMEKKPRLVIDLHAEERSLLSIDPPQIPAGTRAISFQYCGSGHSFIVQPGARDFLLEVSKAFKIVIASRFPIELTKMLIGAANQADWYSQPEKFIKAPVDVQAWEARLDIESCYGKNGLRNIPNGIDWQFDLRQLFSFARVAPCKNLLIIASDLKAGWKAWDFSRIIKIRREEGGNNGQRKAPASADQLAKDSETLLYQLRARLADVARPLVNSLNEVLAKHGEENPIKLAEKIMEINGKLE